MAQKEKKNKKINLDLQADTNRKKYYFDDDNSKICDTSIAQSKWKYTLSFLNKQAAYAYIRNEIQLLSKLYEYLKRLGTETDKKENG